MSKSMKKWLSISVVMIMCITTAALLSSCGKDEAKKDEPKEEVEVNLFIAASLTDAVGDIVKDFEKENPKIKVKINPDSSGKLKTQIIEGFDCDLFFSAGEKEIDELEDKGLIKDDDEIDLLENQLAIVGVKGYKGKVKDLDSLKNADSIALAYGSVPVGFYARKALIESDIIDGDDDDTEAIKAITGDQISRALGGVTISEKDNVSTALAAVAEESTEVGFAYTSDVKRNANTEIIKKIDKELTGDIVYPLAKIKSKEKMSDDKKKSVELLYKYLQNDNSKKIYKKYGFIAK